MTDNCIVRKAKDEKKYKKSSNFIAFRADDETSEMLRSLESMKNKSKTEIILHAIKTSHNIIMFECILEKLKPVLRKIFPAIKIRGCVPKYRPTAGTYEDKTEITYEEIYGFFSLGVSKEMKNEKNIFLNKQYLELTMSIKNLHVFELEFVVPLLDQNVEKIPAAIFKKIYEVATKKGLNLESTGNDKKRTQIAFILKGVITDNSTKWNLIERDLKKIKDALTELREFEKRSVLKEEKNDDV